MTREEGKEFANALKNNYTIDFDKIPDFCDLVITALSENKGEWIFYDEEFYQQCRFASAVHHRIRECSICHHKIADFVGNMDYCPNCGADMRGKENE